MKTTPNPTRPAASADPRIVQKVRRDYAAYAQFEELPGEQDHNYLPQPGRRPPGLRAASFGRPIL